ncbi:MAG: hypothetical protein QOI55_1997, partial [Actinomycetota bacterium]|nr:hypothetical protein [Actinomycetota bacterium]
MPAAAIGTRKARTLLKVLALGRGRPVSVDRIVEVLWDEAPPARANEQVAVLVSRLRGTLGRERLAFGDGGYTLQVDWLDLDALDALAQEAQRRLDAAGYAAARSAAGAALALARGALLIDEPDAPWLDLERATAARLVARTRHVAGQAALATGDPVDAAEFAQGALDHDPYDEEALRLLMRAWVAAGRPASALAAYAHTRTRLGEDLGVGPSAETEAVHTAIVRDEPLGDAAQASPVTELVGRDRELAALDAAARVGRAGTPHEVHEIGDAGIGKSTLH